jgi:hypothetical protein
MEAPCYPVLQEMAMTLRFQKLAALTTFSMFEAFSNFSWETHACWIGVNKVSGETQFECRDVFNIQFIRARAKLMPCLYGLHRLQRRVIDSSTFDIVAVWPISLTVYFIFRLDHRADLGQMWLRIQHLASLW